MSVTIRCLSVVCVGTRTHIGTCCFIVFQNLNHLSHLQERDRQSNPSMCASTCWEFFVSYHKYLCTPIESCVSGNILSTTQKQTTDVFQPFSHVCEHLASIRPKMCLFNCVSFQSQLMENLACMPAWTHRKCVLSGIDR